MKRKMHHWMVINCILPPLCVTLSFFQSSSFRTMSGSWMWFMAETVILQYYIMTHSLWCRCLHTPAWMNTWVLELGTRQRNNHRHNLLEDRFQLLTQPTINIAKYILKTNWAVVGELRAVIAELKPIELSWNDKIRLCHYFSKSISKGWIPH